MSRKIFLPRPEAENISLASSPSPKQRVVAHLGRKDQLAPHLDALIRLLQDETQAPRWVPIQDVSAPRASTWVPSWWRATCSTIYRWARFWMGSVRCGATDNCCQNAFSRCGESSHSSWQ